MDPQNPEAFRAPKTGSSESVTSAGGPSKSIDIAGDRSAQPTKSAESRPGQPSQAQLEGVDTKKLQHAIENLVGRIAEARSRGAARVHGNEVYAHHRASAGSDAAHGRTDNEGMPGSVANQGTDQPPPHSPNPGRRLAAVELRMRQIAELAGAPLAEDISADIAALRSKMDRLSRSDGVLSNRMESIQRQLSHLRESFDSSSAPVVDRLVELETRLDDIGEALANRQLSVEARSAVEHSCSHILGGIARIEALARQAVVPESTLDQIATVRARVERLPTIDAIAALEKRIHEVSQQLGKVADRSERSEDMASLKRHLSEIGAATKAAVEEIRERPAYDPTDVRALLQRIETWRGEKASSDSPGVGAKLDAIARQVDTLSKSDHRAALAKIQEGLSELIGVVSAQNANLSGLDLASLQARLAMICDELSSGQNPPPVEADAEPSVAAGFSDPQGEEEDHKLAKELAVRFAPQGERGGSAQAADQPNTEDVSGAFDALQDALESLVGQIPFMERSWEPGRRSSATQQNRAASADTLSPERQASNQPANPGAAGSKYRETTYALSAAQASDRLSGPATSENTAAPAVLEPKEPRERPAPSTQTSAATGERSTYADAAHRIGRYSTWRKAKVAVVAANTPKY